MSSSSSDGHMSVPHVSSTGAARRAVDRCETNRRSPVTRSSQTAGPSTRIDTTVSVDSPSRLPIPIPTSRILNPATTTSPAAPRQPVLSDLEVRFYFPAPQTLRYPVEDCSAQFRAEA
ncbi:unnamed protein product [Macrosiphum euphorbiae]|uniref:Uncharacterized protein n=1 Tax=Macrosiphum euphorbiae TaxID=13131 RepID=A0AAV0WB92_9HEMI|nr:unnamed protein product [Macrosiphum euphorbiae]